MERDYGLEIDQLRGEIAALRQLLSHLTGNSAAQPEKDASLPRTDKDGHIAKMSCMHPDEHIRALLDALEDKANVSGASGCVTYLGTYESGGNQSTWIRNEVDIDPLLRQIEDRSAERVLACIGSSDRLRLLLALLRRPLTVQQMVQECGFHTAGQAYHHLRPLIAADLVTEDEHGARGTYVIRPHRVSGLIMLLAGIYDLLDGEYTQADYEHCEEADD